MTCLQLLCLAAAVTSSFLWPIRYEEDFKLAWVAFSVAGRDHRRRNVGADPKSMKIPR